MKKFAFCAAIALGLSAAANAGDIPDNIKAAIDNPMRLEENRARDDDRKPAKVLTFFGVEEGMNVADLLSAGGYFTEILSGAVGSEGSVSAHHTAGERYEQRREALEAHYPQFGNVTIDVVEQGASLPYADDSLDFVMLSLIVHHLHYTEESGEDMPTRASEIYADIQRVLKPGGVFGVIEHTAAPGSSRAESASWHRAPEETIKSDITSVGFIFDGAGDIHNNPDDDLQNVWFDAGLQGKTTRFVHRYKAAQ